MWREIERNEVAKDGNRLKMEEDRSPVSLSNIVWGKVSEPCLQSQTICQGSVNDGFRTGLTCWRPGPALAVASLTDQWPSATLTEWAARAEVEGVVLMQHRLHVGPQPDDLRL